MIDLTRPAGGATHLAGALHRRYMRRADSCTVSAPFHVTACSAGGIDVVYGDVAPPVSLAPCVHAPPQPSRAEHWRRE